MSEPNSPILTSPEGQFPDAERVDSTREARTFFTIITILLGYVSLYEIFGTPALAAYSRLIPYLLLMGAHITLHWLSLRFSLNARRQWMYVLLQAILGLSITLISQSETIALALFTSLVAEIIGLLGIRRITVIAVIVFIASTFLSFYLIDGIQLVQEMAAPSLWTFLFLILFMGMFRRQLDMREQAGQLLRELKGAYEQLSISAQQIEELTLTTERQRLARELHDTLAQDMSGLVLQLEAVKHHLNAGNIERIGTIVDQAMQKTRNTLADTRRAIDDLHLEVEAPSLGVIIQEKVDQFSNSTGINFELDLAIPELVTLPYQVREYAIRIINECLSNVARHAQATTVWLTIKQEGSDLWIEIRDDGQGFDPQESLPDGHYGLQGMVERAALVDGQIEIDSQPGKGCTIRSRLPIEENAK